MQRMKVEKVPSRPHGLHRGVAPIIGADGHRFHAIIGIQIQPSAFRRFQGLFHQLRLQTLAKGADVLLGLPIAHRQIAGQLGKARLPFALEPLCGSERGQRAADGAQPQSTGK